ncbi:hypothetical protein DYB32_002011 [Aphanomyces invadans]|uniref:Amino acid transporter n=1 Tax=Aphanomyces invadans TaxID=157072 RepID=A0A3R6VR19_9STRA|nr:hypothetical protein DYB32_002011 [Aphanomyces invadans]
MDSPRSTLDDVNGAYNLRRRGLMDDHAWKMQGAWHKRMYFGEWGILVGILLGIVTAICVDAISTAAPKDFDTQSESLALWHAELTRMTDVVKLRHLLNKWIGLPGVLFIRSLTLWTVPYVFTSVVVGVAELVRFTKAKHVVWRFISLSLVTTVSASLLGLLLMHIPPTSWVTPKQSTQLQPLGTQAAPECPVVGSSKYVLAINTTSQAIACVKESALYPVTDVYEFAMFLDPKTTSAVSGWDSMYNMTLELAPDNLVAQFMDENRLSGVVVVAVLVGLLLGANRVEYIGTLLQLVAELHVYFRCILRWVVNTVPIAIMFLVASSLIVPDASYVDVGMLSVPPLKPANVSASERDASLVLYKSLVDVLKFSTHTVFSNASDDLKLLAVLASVFVCGAIVHCLVVLPVVAFIATSRRNPFVFMNGLRSAMAFGFGSSSSIASLQALAQCIDSTRLVSRQITDALLPIATTMHSDGAAFYLSACTVFLLRAQESTIDVTMSVEVFFLSILQSWTCPPVPGGGTMALCAMWVILKGRAPMYFIWVLALDALLDRLATVISMLSNAIITWVIAEQIDETYIDEKDRDLATRHRTHDESATLGERQKDSGHE